MMTTARKHMGSVAFGTIALLLFFITETLVVHRRTLSGRRWQLYHPDPTDRSNERAFIRRHA